MKGKFPVAVGADNQIVYATKLGSSVLERCDAPYDKASSCQIADTSGMSILEGRSVSINPSSHQTYITASSSGPAGNIFQRLDDMGDLQVDKILEGVKDYSYAMENQVNAHGDSQKLQNEQITSGMTRKQALEIAIPAAVPDYSKDTISTGAHSPEPSPVPTGPHAGRARSLFSPTAENAR